MACVDVNGNEIINFILNEDGTVSGVVNLLDNGGGTIDLPNQKYNILNKSVNKVKLSKECCLSRNFTYDDFSGNCYWSLPCEDLTSYDIYLGSNEFQNMFFESDSGDTCVIKGSFDFLVNYNCNDLLECYVNNSGNTKTTNIDQINKLNQSNEKLINYKNELINNEELKNKEYLNKVLEISNLISSTEDNTQYLLEQKEFLINSEDESDQIELVKIIKDIQNNNDLISKNKILLNDIEFQKNDFDNLNKLTEIDLEMENNNSILKDLSGDTTEEISFLYSNLLECLKITFNIDVIEQPISEDNPNINVNNIINRVYTENIYGFENLLSFLTNLNDNNSDSGILLNGDNCDLFLNNLYNELGEDCTLINENTFNSNWVNYDFVINDESILQLIRGKEFRISFTVDNQCCCPFSLLLDNIKVEKVCEITDDSFEMVKGCFGFEIEKVKDNKKTWVNIEGEHNRIHDLSLRETNYDINDYRLSINTKEVDINLDLANAVEIDLFDYVLDNDCLLACYTGDTIVDYVLDENYLTTIQDEDSLSFLMDEEDYELLSNLEFLGCNDCFLVSGTCGDMFLDLKALITSDISILNNPEELRNVILSELIDAKNRKILKEYPTLKALYHRYLNTLKYCGVNSASYTIYDIEKFSILLGTYWVDLVEQFVPSTTIWESTHIYSNTIFDQDKFNYKTSSLFTCKLNNLKELVGLNVLVGVEIEDITNNDKTCEILDNTTNCNGVFIYQYDNGSEFIGSIVDLNEINQNENVNNGDTGVDITTPIIAEQLIETA